jgi:YhcH/YjgK/YiaL family protein
MITGRIEDLRNYGVPAEGIEEALDWLEKAGVETLEPGRYPLEGTEAFAIVAEGTTVPEESEEWEAHRRYADLQVVLSGDEVMGFAPLSEMTPKGRYDEQTDCQVFSGTGNFLQLHAGGFAFFAPHDAHKAMLSPKSGPFRVRKVIFKLPWKA